MVTTRKRKHGGLINKNKKSKKEKLRIETKDVIKTGTKNINEKILKFSDKFVSVRVFLITLLFFRLHTFHHILIPS